MSLPLIDCRSAADYQRSHIVGATSIPAAEMPQRMHELPKTSQPLTLCGDVASLHAAHEFLTRKGYQVAAQTEWTAQLISELQGQGRLVAGMDSLPLWRAAPLIERFVTDIAPAYHGVPGKGLDIGCGSGRDLVYLASHGWEMTGIDYMEAALQRAQALAATRQVSIRTECRDLETGTDPFVDYAAASFDLICVARYLHRPLFPWIKRLLKPGGIVIYQTFMQGCETTEIGRPRNPNFLLRAGELAEHFAGAEILLDEVETLADGRPVSAFICRWGD
ncbi:MAG: methyltransferase domain-containing protein [Thiothrix sp.]